MPRYMMDTSMCIYLMKNQPESVARRFAKCFVGDVVSPQSPTLSWSSVSEHRLTLTENAQTWPH